MTTYYHTGGLNWVRPYFSLSFNIEWTLCLTICQIWITHFHNSGCWIELRIKHTLKIVGLHDCEFRIEKLEFCNVFLTNITFHNFLLITTTKDNANSWHGVAFKNCYGHGEISSYPYKNNLNAVLNYLTNLPEKIKPTFHTGKMWPGSNLTSNASNTVSLATVTHLFQVTQCNMI